VPSLPNERIPRGIPRGRLERRRVACFGRPLRERPAQGNRQHPEATRGDDRRLVERDPLSLQREEHPRRHEPPRPVVAAGRPPTLANARRIMEGVALLGWGRLEISLFDSGRGRLLLTLKNRPLARAYGTSKKPVCHFLTGWITSLGRTLLEREVLCEETACAAQGQDRCEFELRPMPPSESRKDFYPYRLSERGSGRSWSVLTPLSSAQGPRAPRRP